MKNNHPDGGELISKDTDIGTHDKPKSYYIIGIIVGIFLIIAIVLMAIALYC